MKTIYNTLTTSDSIHEFLKDGGHIFVKYNKVNHVSDMYDIANIVEIKCVFPSCEENGYTACVTYMDKFFRFSLFQIATPNHVKEAQEHVTIEFTAKKDSWETRKNEFRIINELETMVKEALDDIDHYERRIRLVNARVRIFDELNSRERFTDKYINTIRNDNEMCDLLALDNIYLCTGWYDNNEIREQLKNEKKQLEKYFSDCTSTEMLEYYTNELNKAMQYIA